ncbi:MAG TPA: hypothetical protein VLA95_06045 [Gemmatimonadales bacterium]|nr:hypothetical protein [Gemmatimonadales bacterium]
MATRRKKPQLESPTPRTVRWLKEMKKWTIALTAWGKKIAKRVRELSTASAAQEQRIKDLEARVAALEACCGIAPKKKAMAMMLLSSQSNDPPPPPKDWP